MKIKILYGLSLLVCLVVLLKFTSQNTETNEAKITQSMSENHTYATKAVADEERYVISEQWSEANNILSLAGTHIDGELAEDERGNLIVNLSAKDFFDYFLSAVGERTEEEVLSELALQIKGRLSEKAARQAIALLHSYVQYQVHMTSMIQAPLSPYEKQDYRYYADVMSSAFAELKSVRREYFDPATVDAFFSFEETYGDFSVGMLLVEADRTLSEQQRQDQIEQLKSQLPDEMKQAEVRATERTERVQQVRELYQDGTRDSAQVSESISDFFSEQEIKELFAFYARESQWQKKTQQYFEQKAGIRRSGLADVDAELAIASLRESLFKEAEINRLLSEEAIMRDTSNSSAEI